MLSLLDKSFGCFKTLQQGTVTKLFSYHFCIQTTITSKNAFGFSFKNPCTWVPRLKVRARHLQNKQGNEHVVTCRRFLAKKKVILLLFCSQNFFFTLQKENSLGANWWLLYLFGKKCQLEDKVEHGNERSWFWILPTTVKQRKSELKFCEIRKIRFIFVVCLL